MYSTRIPGVQSLSSCSHIIAGSCLTAALVQLQHWTKVSMPGKARTQAKVASRVAASGQWDTDPLVRTRWQARRAVACKACRNEIRVASAGQSWPLFALGKPLKASARRVFSPKSRTVSRIVRCCSSDQARRV